jgi:cell division inhibitor SepF
MPGVWKKTLNYLGLVEDEEYDEHELAQAEAVPELPSHPATSRRFGRSEAVAVQPVAEPSESVIRTIPQPRPMPATTIHRSEPKMFNEARELGERFRQGIPVIMNLQGTEDATARRLVDFASGLVFGLGGRIETVANRVYMLTPANVEVSAEERERIREGGFYNQF